MACFQRVHLSHSSRFIICEMGTRKIHPIYLTGLSWKPCEIKYTTTCIKCKVSLTVSSVKPLKYFASPQFSSVTQSCPTLSDPMNRRMPGLPVHHQLLEFTQTHVHRVSDAIQPSHPLSSPSPSAPKPSPHQGLFQ